SSASARTPPPDLPLNVRFGSLADISQHIRDVRFTLKSGHPQRRHRCSLSATSGHSSSVFVPTRVDYRRGFLIGTGGVAPVSDIAAGSISCTPIRFVAGGLGRGSAPEDTATCRGESPRARSEEAKALEDRLGTMACGRAAAGVGVRSSGVDSRASLAFLTAFGSSPVVSKGFANRYVVACGSTVAGNAAELVASPNSSANRFSALLV